MPAVNGKGAGTALQNLELAPRFLTLNFQLAPALPVPGEFHYLLEGGAVLPVDGGDAGQADGAVLDLVLAFVHVPAVHAGNAAQLLDGLVEAVGQGIAAGVAVIAIRTAQGPIRVGAGTQSPVSYPQLTLPPLCSV